MQDRYTGDIGDFGKYGLLRALTAPETGGPPELGVVWCLTPDETGSQDGKQTGYLHLKEPEKHLFANCDEELYLALQGLVDSGSRSVKAVQQSGILPDGTAYHAAALDLRKPEKKPGETVRQARDRERTEWREAALETTEGCQLVFLDPDNGLETPSVRPHAVQAAKYVYYDDLDPYLKRGQSLVICHHLNRGRKSLEQVYRRQREIYERLGSRALAMRYHRGSPRAFILMGQGRHRRVPGPGDTRIRQAVGPLREQPPGPRRGTDRAAGQGPGRPREREGRRAAGREAVAAVPRARRKLRTARAGALRPEERPGPGNDPGSRERKTGPRRGRMSRIDEMVELVRAEVTAPGTNQKRGAWNERGDCCTGSRIAHALGVPSGMYLDGIDEWASRMGMTRVQIIAMLQDAGASQDPIGPGRWPETPGAVWQRLAEAQDPPGFAGRDLSRLNLAGTGLQGLDLNGCNLEGANLRGPGWRTPISASPGCGKPI